MPQDLQQNRYDQLIRRVGDLKGPGSKVNEVLAELFPVIDVENIPVELLALMGTNIAAGGQDNAGVAAVNQRSQLMNPTGSGKLITVTDVSINSDTAQQIVMGLVAVALTTNVGTQRFRDGRLTTTQVPTGEIRTDSSAAAAPVVYRFDVEAAVNVFFHDNKGIWVLSPGTGLQISTTTVNTSLTTGYQWRERVAEPSEFNF